MQIADAIATISVPHRAIGRLRRLTKRAGVPAEFVEMINACVSAYSKNAGDDEGLDDVISGLMVFADTRGSLAQAASHA